MLKQYFNVKILIFSLIPFLLWLIPALSGNVSISTVTLLFGVIFLILCLSTAYLNKVGRLIALIALSITVFMLFQESTSNDMFGKLYPIGLAIFSLYYLGLNYYMYLHA